MVLYVIRMVVLSYPQMEPARDFKMFSLFLALAMVSLMCGVKVYMHGAELQAE